MTYLSAGRTEEADDYAREALALSRRLGARASEAHALCLVGDVASIGSAEDAEGHYREAHALADELGMRPLQARCHLGLGKLLARTDQHDKACAELETAVEMFRDVGMNHWLPEAEAALAGVTT
jgi:tetratricopeptide (TPR) repeat protein